MPSNAGILLNLLGSFLGDSTPKLNQGAYTTDQQGNVIAPYSSPGWATRFFHPEVAQYESQANNQAQSGQAQAALQNLIAHKVANTNTQTARSGMGMSLADMPVDALTELSGRNPGASSLEDVANKSAQYSAGIPELSASDLGSSLKLNTMGNEAALASKTPELQNRNAVQGYGLDFLRRPYSTANEIGQNLVGLQGANMRLSNPSLEQDLYTGRAKSEIASDLARQQQAQRDIDNDPALSQLFKTELGTKQAEASTSSGLAKDRLGKLSSLLSIQDKNIAGQDWQSNFLPSAETPFSTKINPDGSVSPNIKRTDFVSPIQQKLVGLEMGTGSPSGVKLPGGGALPMVDKKYDTSTGSLIGNSSGALAHDLKQSISKPESKDIRETMDLTPANAVPQSNEEFFNKLKDKSGKGHKAMDSIAEQLADKFGIPVDKFGVSQDKYVTTGILPFIGSTPDSQLAKVGRKYTPSEFWKDAMLGGNPNIHWKDILQSIENMPEEERSAFYKKALKAGGYK